MRLYVPVRSAEITMHNALNANTHTHKVPVVLKQNQISLLIYASGLNKKREIDFLSQTYYKRIPQDLLMHFIVAKIKLKH